MDNSARAVYAKMVTRLFDHWQLSDADRLAMLGLSKDSRQTLSHYRKGKPLLNRRDLLDRVAYLLDIHVQLRLIFPKNKNLGYGWMTARLADFGAQTPVEIVRLHGIVGLNMLSAYLTRATKE